MVRDVGLLAFVAFVVFLSISDCAVGEPSAGSPPDVLVYSRPQHGLFVWAAGEEARLSFNQADYLAPRLSPDNTRILCNSKMGGDAGIWIIDRAGGEPSHVTTGTQAVWSPDGNRILFARDGRLVERELATGKETDKSPDGVRLQFPGYIPGSENLLCVDEAKSKIFVIEGTAVPREVAAGEIASPPRCSPDGRTIAYQSGPHIYALDVASGEVRQLTTDFGVQGYPAWSADGAGLCYARALYPPAEEWEICHAKLAEPRAVSVIQSGVYASFDWNGTVPESSTSQTTPGGRLETKRAEGSPFMIANDWCNYEFGDSGISITANQGGQRINIGMYAAPAIKDAKEGADACTVTAGLGERDATVKVPCARPMLEVTGANAIEVQGNFAFVVAPDRLADDLVLYPPLVPPGTKTHLPASQMVIACLADSPALVVIVARAPASFTAASTGAAITSISAGGVEGGIGVALLANGQLWSKPELAQSDGTWRAPWDKPFIADWRLAMRSGTRAFSRTFTAFQLGELGEKTLPVEASFDTPPDAAVVYVWARDEVTPPEVVTPCDVALDTLGPAGYIEAMDIAGIRGYRTGDPPTPFRELVVHGPEWHPALATFEEDKEIGVLEAMGSVFPVDTPGVRSLVTHLGDDSMAIANGLETRAVEYESFLRELSAYCGTQQGKFAQWAKKRAEELIAAGKTAERTDVERARLALNKVTSTLGSRDDLTLTVFGMCCRIPGNEEWANMYEEFFHYLAAQEGRVWHNDRLRFELWYDDAFETFSRRCQKIVKERQKLLSSYRAYAREIRDDAAVIAMYDESLQPMCNEMRQRTGAVLRNRFYLEGDWRGEKPLATGVLP